MALNSNSRYQTGTITRLANAAGTYNLTLIRSVPPNTSNYKLYVWQAGDRPDLVALKELGSTEFWWAIFDINPEFIDPLNVPAGAIVRIPTGPVQGQGTLSQ